LKKAFLLSQKDGGRLAILRINQDYRSDSFKVQPQDSISQRGTGKMENHWGHSLKARWFLFQEPSGFSSSALLAKREI
jgi:hypothetical protein